MIRGTGAPHTHTRVVGNREIATHRYKAPATAPKQSIDVVNRSRSTATRAHQVSTRAGTIYGTWDSPSDDVTMQDLPAGATVLLF